MLGGEYGKPIQTQDHGRETRRLLCYGKRDGGGLDEAVLMQLERMDSDT